MIITLTYVCTNATVNTTAKSILIVSECQLAHDIFVILSEEARSANEMRPIYGCSSP